jgi:ABC-type branched-subunit amino acid transport system permease subunit
MRELSLAAAALAALVAMPWFTSDYIVGVGVTAFTFTVAAASLNLVYGYAGLLSFAQLAFWGIGGYCTALIVVDAGGWRWLPPSTRCSRSRWAGRRSACSAIPSSS